MVIQVVPQTASSAMDKETGTPQVKVAQQWIYGWTQKQYLCRYIIYYCYAIGDDNQSFTPSGLVATAKQEC